MTEPNNNDAFDTLVRDALRQDARRAPQLSETWRGDTDPTSTSPESSHRPRRFAIIGAVAASVLLITALALVANQRGTDVAPAANPPSWQPQGTEFPIVDLGPATEVTDGPVVESLTRRIGIESHPDQILDTSLMYLGNDTAVEQRCAWEVNGGGACRPAWNGQTWTTSITSSIDNHLADRDLWRIEGLPDEAVFVSYSDGDLQLWQRPIAGFAAFPNVDGDDEVVIAYDASGSEVGRFGSGRTNEQLNNDVAAPPRADLSTAQQTELAGLTTQELTACLVGNGATISAGGVATFAPEADQLTVWSSCVELVQDTVGRAVASVDSASQSSDAVPSTVGPGCATHIVVKGDSIMSIAQRYSITFDELAAANTDLETLLQIGAEISIPCSATPVGVSEDQTGVESFEHVTISPDFSVSNTVRFATTDDSVYVISGGNDNQGGAILIDRFDRITGELAGTSQAPVPGCAGPVTISEAPVTDPAAVSITCTPTGTKDTLDVFTSQTKSST